MPLRFRILPAPAEIRAGWAAARRSGQGDRPRSARSRSRRRWTRSASADGRARRSSCHFPRCRRSTRGCFGVSRGAIGGSRISAARTGPGSTAFALSRAARAPCGPGQRLRIATVDIVFEGWSATARGAESTASIARRLISDLFGVVGGDVPTLAVEAGPARPSAVRLVDRDRRYLAGRADGCDVVLPSEHVSREHAAFVRHWDGVVVSDLGSKNGVLVNGTAIVGQAKLGDGDRIEVGPVVFRFTDPEDRYIRRLESLENQVGGVVDAGTPPQTAAALIGSRSEALPSAAAVALDRQPIKGGASASAPEPPAPPMADLEESRRPRRSKKWVASALVGAVVVVAIAGLILLLVATR